MAKQNVQGEGPGPMVNRIVDVTVKPNQERPGFFLATATMQSDDYLFEQVAPGQTVERACAFALSALSQEILNSHPAAAQIANPKGEGGGG